MRHTLDMGSPSKDTDDHPVLAKIRALLEELPEACEVEAWGHPTFRAGPKKMFAAFGGYADRPSMSIKQTPADQAFLVEDDRFFLPKYVAKQGWVGLYVDEVKWPTIRDLLVKGYRLVALQRMLRALDGA